MQLPIKMSLPYPVSVNNYYRTFRNVQTISKEGKTFKKKVQADYYELKPITNKVTLNIIIHPKQNKDGSASKTLIDIDNSLKCLLDSLEGIIYINDKQVRSLSISYGYAKVDGGMTVIVDYFNQNECILLSDPINYTKELE